MAFKLANVRVVEELKKASTTNSLPGYAIAILEAGECLDIETIGLAELENNIPISTKTRFHVASLAKQFTGLAIGLIEKQGGLGLSDYASDYLPEIDVLNEGVTIQHLLQHTSGLRDQWVLLEMAGWRANDTIITQDILEILKKQRTLNFRPGERFMYSNSGYSLLAEIVSRVSGISFRQFVDKNILSPLEMYSSLFADEPNEIISNRAYAYSSSTDKEGNVSVSRFFPNLYAPGATSFITTIEDMVKWDKNFYEVNVGDRDLNTRLRSLGDTKPSRKTGYDYGHFYERNIYGEMVFHSGMDFGFQSFYGQYIDNDISVVILSNASPTNIFSMANEIAISFVEKPVVSSIHFEVESTEKSEVNFEQYCGVYENSKYDDVWIVEVENENLTIRSTGKSVFIHLGGDRFQMKGGLIECEFLRKDDNSISSVIIAGVGDDIICTKIDIEYKKNSGCIELVGKYWSPELDCFSYVRKSESKYHLDLPKNITKEIIKIAEGIYFSGGSWIRITNADGKKGFTLSDTRAKRIRFFIVDNEVAESIQ